MKHWTCDLCGSPMPGPEVSTLTLKGPLREATCRGELHTCKPCLYAVAERFNIRLATPPDYLSGDMVARRKAEAPAADLAALRVDALGRGTPAGSTAPPPKPSRGRSKVSA